MFNPVCVSVCLLLLLSFLVTFSVSFTSSSSRMVVLYSRSCERERICVCWCVRVYFAFRFVSFTYFHHIHLLAFLRSVVTKYSVCVYGSYYCSYMLICNAHIQTDKTRRYETVANTLRHSHTLIHLIALYSHSFVRSFGFSFLAFLT